MTHRFPFVAHLRANVGFGAYLYNTNGLENNSYYAEAGASRTISRRHFFFADLRQYVGSALESSHLSVETGITF